MTREEFHEIDNISDLLDVCSDWGCDVYDEMYDEDGYSDCIDDKIESMIRYDKWTEVRDYLDNLPDTDFDYYRRTDDGWEGIDEGSDFESLRDEVEDWAESNHAFDDEEDEPEPDEREEYEADWCEEDDEETVPDEPFTLGELVAVCKSSVQKIEDKSKSEPDKASEEEYVKTCDPIALFKEN